MLFLEARLNSRLDGIVKEYREKRIEGQFVDLVPYTMNDANNVIDIRNRDKNRYYLNQNYSLTYDSQAKWYDNYLSRRDDIYWCIYNKRNRFVGTVRIYNIDVDNNMCDQGSLIIDEDVAREEPYAVEAELLTLDFVFNILQIGNVINEDRADNMAMISLTKKLGFKYIKNIKLGEVEYKHYLLTYENYQKKRVSFARAIERWAMR